jgi:hypothetical protein
MLRARATLGEQSRPPLRVHTPPWIRLPPDRLPPCGRHGMLVCLGHPEDETNRESGQAVGLTLQERGSGA